MAILARAKPQDFIFTLHYDQVSELDRCGTTGSPIFDGTGDVEEFIKDMSFIILEERLAPTLDVTLQSTLARWWATHKDDL
jgi:hypothetical protein|uniref:Uncharacterized protein n=1 Tax=Picea glauca TaxID=3330 RepID=A0A101LV62_PICGL|nr:hypothetical protein ABT39_MTgene2028 [Picea glauca]